MSAQMIPGLALAGVGIYLMIVFAWLVWSCRNEPPSSMSDDVATPRGRGPHTAPCGGYRPDDYYGCTSAYCVRCNG